MRTKFGITVATAALLLAVPAVAQTTAPATPEPTPPVTQPQAPGAAPENAPSTAPNMQGGTEMKAPDTSAAAPAIGAPAGFVTAQGEAQWMVSNLMGKSVVGTDDKTIGEINDVVLDQEGKADAAVIGVGGFLGIGQKNVAIPFSELQVSKNAEGEVEKIMLSATREQLEQAPAFKTLADIRSEQDRMSTGSTRPADPTAPPATTAPKQ